MSLPRNVERVGRLSSLPHAVWGWSIALVLTAAAAGGFQTAFADTDGVSPASVIYLRLALDRYLRIEEKGGWPTVPDGSAMRIGSTGPSVALLRERLSATNDLTSQDENPSDFDDDLTAAVMHFQTRHGLEADGVVGRRTRAAMNVSVAHRIQQIIANLKRFKSLHASDGGRMILVNVASFGLNVIEDGEVVFSSPVIVGRSTRRTPVLSSAITKIIVNPYWYVPRRLAIRDILPKLKEDPSYLTAQAMRVFIAAGGSLVEVLPDSVQWQTLNTNNFPYTLVQDPGPMNALGQIKFFLPNEQDIYLHDTPARALFKRDLRAFSSGCIRVQNALELAQYLLTLNAGNSPNTLREALKSGKTEVIRLTDPIPIHIVYFTAWADAYGQAYFRDDIYSLDRVANAKLKHRGKNMRDVARASDSLSKPACLAITKAPGGKG